MSTGRAKGNPISDKFLQTEVTLDGETKTVAEWCEIKGTKISTVYDRRRRWCNWVDSFKPRVKKPYKQIVSKR